MKKIFILTGEPSGDKLASEVISKIKKKRQSILLKKMAIRLTKLVLIMMEKLLWILVFMVYQKHLL